MGRGDHLKFAVSFDRPDGIVAGDDGAVGDEPHVDFDLLVNDLSALLQVFFVVQVEIVDDERVEVNPVTQAEFYLLGHDIGDPALDERKWHIFLHSLATGELHRLVFAEEGDGLLLGEEFLGVGE